MLTRKRSSGRTQHDKLGYIEILKTRKPYIVMGLNIDKIYKALLHGAHFHASAYNLIYNSYLNIKDVN